MPMQQGVAIRLHSALDRLTHTFLRKRRGTGRAHDRGKLSVGDDTLG